ncbi:MAG: 4-hydroxy-3-methylbut-2-enyl diphosphate reductase, partial [Verrucomicrobiota bacterium]
GRGYVISNEADLDALPDLGDKVCLVSQSTMCTDEFERLAARLRGRVPSALVFDTICGATKDRQSDVVELRKQGCEAVVVIGGRHSANTVKLASLVEREGLPSFHVETAAELDLAAVGRYRTVGVTAGASTPAFLIDEVCARLAGLP